MARRSSLPRSTRVTEGPVSRLRGLLLWIGALAAPASAQNVATSPAPDRVAVTVYRDPNRPAAQRPELQWLQGFALISETRHVTLPAGESELRFEGVAGGIIPQTAIVTGLPDGIVERNRDAYLLSPGTLLDRSLGRRVHLRRTSRASGAVREQDAVIRSGNDGGVVLQTEEGFEARVAPGLPKPWSMMRSRSDFLRGQLCRFGRARRSRSAPL